MYRNEKKYVLNSNTARLLEAKLRQVCILDENGDDDGRYRVTSFYFDDYCNSALNDNIVGQIDRKKYRIRVYDGSDSYIRLEKKIKHNSGGKKESIMLSREDYDSILAGDYQSLMATESTLLRGFLLEAATRKLRPKVIVDYKRQTFIYKHGAVRITLDHDIRYGSNGMNLFDDNLMLLPATEPNQVVLEVKYTGFLPGHIKDMVQQSVTRQQGVSKYSMCRACGF